MDNINKDTSEKPSDVFLFSELEIKVGYIWRELIFKKISLGLVKISYRLIRKHIDNCKPIIDYLIENNYIKVAPGGEGGFRKGVTTYQVLKIYDTDCMKQQIDELSIKISNKHKKRHDSMINMTGVEFGEIDLTEKDRNIIKSLKDNGVRQRMITFDRLFYSEFCSLSKIARNQLSYNGEKFVEIDINAAIPRLLTTYLYKKVENWNNNDEIMDEISIWTSIITEKDAYVGLMEYFKLPNTYTRTEFKKSLLPILFGAGAKDIIDQDIVNALIKNFPNIKKLLQNQSQMYRLVKNKSKTIKTWREGLFVREIFKIESRIVNKALKLISGKKYSVYDSIGVLEHNSETCLEILRKCWKDVVGSDILFAASDKHGVLRFASDVSSANATETLSDNEICTVKDPKPITVLRGEGGTIISLVFSLTVQISQRKTRNRKSEITETADGRWRWRYNKKPYISKVGETKEEFKQRVLSQ